MLTMNNNIHIATYYNIYTCKLLYILITIVFILDETTTQEQQD